MESAGNGPLNVGSFDSLVNALPDENVNLQQQERIATPLASESIEEEKASSLDAFPESTSAPGHLDNRPVAEEEKEPAEKNKEVDEFLKGTMDSAEEGGLAAGEKGADLLVQELEKARGKVTEAKCKLATALMVVLLVSVAIVAFA
ncbi:hypothetical protein Emed_006058 [Eimeria media]